MNPETRTNLLDAIDDMAACLRRMREEIDRDMADDGDDDGATLAGGIQISDSLLRELSRTYDPLARKGAK